MTEALVNNFDDIAKRLRELERPKLHPGKSAYKASRCYVCEGYGVIRKGGLKEVPCTRCKGTGEEPPPT